MPNYIKKRADSIRMERSLDVLFNETEINNNSTLKLLAAIECGEAQIDFYDLQKKKFFKEIEITRPFLIGIKMNCWTHGQPHHMNKVFSYNKVLSNLLNKIIQSESINFDNSYRYSYYDDITMEECFKKRKQFRRRITSELAPTRESKILFTKFLMLRTESFKSTYSYSFSLTTPFIKDRKNKKRLTRTITPRFRDIEAKLIEQGVNVKYLTYYDLIAMHEREQGSNPLTAYSVIRFLNSKVNSTTAMNWKDFETFKKSHDNQIAFIFQNPYYVSVLPDKQKNTPKKALRLIGINSQINTRLFSKEVYSDLNFIIPCLEKGYSKSNLTNPALAEDSVLIELFSHILNTGSYDLIGNLPNDSLKQISNSTDLSFMLHDFTNKKISEFLTVLQRPVGNIEFHTKRISKIKGELTYCFCHFVPNLHKSFFTRELFDNIILLTKLSADSYKNSSSDNEEIMTFLNNLEFNEYIEQQIAEIKRAIFFPYIWNKFKNSYRKPFERLALEANPYNFNNASIGMKQSVIYEIAEKDICAIGFAKMFGKTPNYPVMLKCLESATTGMTLRNEKILDATHSEPDSHLRKLMEDTGISKSEIKHNGLSYENLQDMIRTLRMRLLEERLPEKGIKTKKLKI